MQTQLGQILHQIFLSEINRDLNICARMNRYTVICFKLFTQLAIVLNQVLNYSAANRVFELDYNAPTHCANITCEQVFFMNHAVKEGVRLWIWWYVCLSHTSENTANQKSRKSLHILRYPTGCIQGCCPTGFAACFPTLNRQRFGPFCGASKHENTMEEKPNFS